MSSINGLAVLQARELTAQEAHALYIEERRDLIRETYAEKASDAEFGLFMELCKARGLNPFLRQIYLIPRTSRGVRKFSAEVGIDGLRLIASRSREYAGRDEYEYDREPERGKPLWARCTVYRMVNGVRCPFTARVSWAESGGSQNLWETMPFHMLGKVSESHALRAAFPEETSGVYTTDEMDGADRESQPQPERIVRQPALARAALARPEPPQRVVRFTDAASDAASTRIREIAAAKGLMLANEPHRVPWKVVINHIRERDGVVDVADDGTCDPRAVGEALLALPDVDEGDESDDETAPVDVAMARDTAGDEAWSPEAVAAIEAQEAREYAAR